MNKNKKDKDKELTALTNFLNDIEDVATKHGWNIGTYENKKQERRYDRNYIYSCFGL